MLTRVIIINVLLAAVPSSSNGIYLPKPISIFNEVINIENIKPIFIPLKPSICGDGCLAEDTVIQTHVLFRHGNRTADKTELYPKDPFLNYSYYPVGHGQLTNVGKKKEYSVGKALRQRYDKFLGPLYLPDIVDARSTDRNRTKMSLLLVLASLFPPKEPEIWNDELNWLPVPYNYYPITNDPILFGLRCPTYEKLYTELENSPEYLEKMSEYDEQFQYISQHSGLNVTKTDDVYNLYFGLATEQEYGFLLPEWTKKVWPDFITSIACEQYDVYTKTTDLRKMAAGYLLQKIIQDTENKIKNISETKIYLYSAHENNIGQLLKTLDIYEYPHIPDYGSYVLLEVHHINNTYGFKIFYQNYNGTSTPKLLKLPSCDEFCPLETFKLLTEEYMPEDGLCGNNNSCN